MRQPMIGELVARFVVGGIIISAFAAAGELFEPKRFGGMTAAAPSTALATLAIAFVTHGGSYVSTEGRSMIAGAGAFFVYAVVTVVAIQRHHVPVGVTAIGAWAVWLAMALGLCMAGRAAGVLG